MPITQNDILPYYQVVVFNYAVDLNLEEYLASFKTRLNEKNEKSRHFFKIDSVISDENPLIIHLVHKRSPTWTTYSDLTNSKKANYLEDLENDVVILYKTESRLYLYSNCATVLILAELAFQYVTNAIHIKRISPKDVLKVLNYEKPQLNTLGIDNVFNAGGSAAESKAYHSKNAKYCLTPSFDSGYGFSYCLGMRVNQNDERQQFGCSLKKSKIWRTWIDEFEEFIVNCDEIDSILDGELADSELEMLVSPVDADDVADFTVASFFLDYAVPNKGTLVIVKDDTLFYEWYCFIQEEDISRLVFLIEGDDDPIEVKLVYSEADGWEYEYVGELEVEVLFIIANGDDDQQGRRKDLVEYLHEQKNYTILLNNGIAFRNGGFWEDTRLTLKFEEITTKYDWDKVDIRKEEKPSLKDGYKNILTSLCEYYDGFERVIAVINDNGANEIADLIVITETRFILVHAKYSSDDFAGLRAGDVQVVSAQALKNLRYYIFESYSDDQIVRLYDNAYKLNNVTSPDDLKSLIGDLLNSYRVVKECCIVQPGISEVKLSNNPNNKIHHLLNFVDSICRSSNVSFSVIGSEVDMREE